MTEDKEEMSSPLETIPESDYIHVAVNTFGVTSAERKNPILKTVYLNTCVGLVLYDADVKVAGLAHISPTSNRVISGHIESMINVMRKYGFDTNHQIDTHLVGGWEDVSSHIPDMYIADTSIEDITSQLDKIVGKGRFRVRTIEKTKQVPQDIAFDSRNGKLIHLLNAKRPKMGAVGTLKALVSPPKGAWLTPDERTLR